MVPSLLKSQLVIFEISSQAWNCQKHRLGKKINITMCACFYIKSFKILQANSYNICRPFSFSKKCLKMTRSKLTENM